MYPCSYSKTIIKKGKKNKDMENKTPYLKTGIGRVRLIGVRHHFNSYLSAYIAELKTLYLYYETEVQIYITGSSYQARTKSL